jgi:hypothetical protein
MSDFACFGKRAKPQYLRNKPDFLGNGGFPKKKVKIFLQKACKRPENLLL